jgi:hypothetical protein
VEFIQQNFIPVRVHIRDNAAEFKRLGAKFGAKWTPTILIIDVSGEERHRIVGFLPAEEYMGQLALGLAHSAFARDDFADAEKRFHEVVDRHSKSEAAAEALYWAGVSRYKATNDGAALSDTAAQFKKRYTETTWAKKASVWGS